MATINVTRKTTAREKSYLPAILMGMKITMRRFIQGFFMRKNDTIQYPEARREYSDRFRGMHFISVDKTKTENCTACFLCETVCPADCIHIVADERDDEENPHGVKKEKKPVSFDIDALRCCFCGFCEEACPKDAIKLSGNYELAVSSREEAIYDLDFLKRDIKGRGKI
ncbi:MAG TPA: NADH-quinone oxidoreductase subunit I [Bacteriovoracaceae bacterium]|nr:NADH-quinone oxidoreductase subunit I [Bacteriovoracaceae bacterium]